MRTQPPRMVFFADQINVLLCAVDIPATALHTNARSFLMSDLGPVHIAAGIFRNGTAVEELLLVNYIADRTSMEFSKLELLLALIEPLRPFCCGRLDLAWIPFNT